MIGTTIIFSMKIRTLPNGWRTDMIPSDAAEYPEAPSFQTSRPPMHPSTKAAMFRTTSGVRTYQANIFFHQFISTD